MARRAMMLSFGVSTQRDLLRISQRETDPRDVCGRAAPLRHENGDSRHPTVASSRPSFVRRIFAELVKARTGTLLVLLTTAVGFIISSRTADHYKALFQTVFGTAAASAGAAALNMVEPPRRERAHASAQDNTDSGGAQLRFQALVRVPRCRFRLRYYWLFFVGNALSGC